MYMKLIADKEYTRVFHSPGLEPWVLGITLMIKPRKILDAGCSYGLWCFLIKNRLKGPVYVVGIDIDVDRIEKAKRMYDDVVLADVRHMPFRSRSFDEVLAIEVLHSLPIDDLRRSINMLSCCAKKVIVCAFPFLSRQQLYIVRSYGFKTYRYMLRGFILVDCNKRKIYSMYDTYAWKLLRTLLSMLTIFLCKTKGYYLAIR